MTATAAQITNFFAKLVAAREIGVYFDPAPKTFETVAPGVHYYRFNGFLGCALVERDGRFYNPADTNKGAAPPAATPSSRWAGRPSPRWTTSTPGSGSN